METHKIGWVNWLTLIVLGAIWGSSFILMKIGSRSLDSFELAAFRLFFAGIFLMPLYIQFIRKVKLNLYLWIVAASLIGSGIPSILYASSSSKIDSNINGVINSLTPIFTLLVGVFWFKKKTSNLSLVGLFIGFFGVIMLLFQKTTNIGNTNYALFPIFASVLYGINVNLVKEKISHLSSMEILAGVFGTLVMISFPYLLYRNSFYGFEISLLEFQFWKPNLNPIIQRTNSVFAIFILGSIGSAFASFLFYFLLKRTNTLFSATNTYLIPLMSIFWGYLDGELIGWMHFVSLFIILVGVYLVSKRKD